LEHLMAAKNQMIENLRRALTVCVSGQNVDLQSLSDIPGIEGVPWVWAREKKTSEFTGDPVGKLRDDRHRGKGYPYAKNGSAVSYFLPLVHALKVASMVDPDRRELDRKPRTTNGSALRKIDQPKSPIADHEIAPAQAEGMS
jgi:hypothetical protein